MMEFNFENLLAKGEIAYLENVADIIKLPKSGAKLCKGDLLLPISKKGFKKVSLFSGDNKEVCIPANACIVRCHEILPEYLQLYLASETAEVICGKYSGEGALQRVNLSTICEFPVLIPTIEKQEQIIYLHRLISTEGRVYNSAQAALLKELGGKTEPEKAEDILSMEMVRNIKMHNEAQLREFLTDDLKELNICFRGKAYKATLILAGSILEAVLIDWLSEIDGVNYFKKNYMVTNQNGKRKRAELTDYIDAIEYLERPRWADEASKAHEIRKKRNLVHAKLCLKSDEVNEQTCRDVISYLKDVLKTRGVQ